MYLARTRAVPATDDRRSAYAQRQPPAEPRVREAKCPPAGEGGGGDARVPFVLALGDDSVAFLVHHAVFSRIASTKDLEFYGPSKTCAVPSSTSLAILTESHK